MGFKIAILAQGVSPSVDGLKKAFIDKGHNVDVLRYCDDQFKPIIYSSNAAERAFLTDKDGNKINPENYQGAILWSWGTASMGASLLNVFERAGVSVLNSTAQTRVTDSKVDLTRLFNRISISVPKTLCFENPDVSNISDSVAQCIGAPPYVLKHDYGTGGKKVFFLDSLESLMAEIARIPEDKTRFIVQEFIGDHKKPIQHFRVLVIGDKVFPKLLTLTAPDVLKPSNVAAGGSAQIGDIAADSEMAALAIAAFKAAGLNVSGVDIMRHVDGRLVVLEANDGPGLKTYLAAGFDPCPDIAGIFTGMITAAMPSSKLECELPSPPSPPLS